MTIKDILKARDVYWISADDTVRQAVRFLCERKIGAVAVKDQDEVVGVFSERDLMHRVVNEGRDPNTTLVREVMSTQLHFIHMDDDIRSAKALMYKNRVRHLLVVGKGNQLRGMVSMRDLVDAEVAESQELIHKLNDAYYEQAYNARWRIVSNRVIIDHYTVFTKNVHTE
jgi:CBS domain-containing protein